MRFYLIVVLLLIAGCATPGQTQMNAEQLKAVAQDKNFSAVCSTILGPWGTGKFVFVNVDRSVVVNGTIGVNADCLVTMSNEATAKPIPVVVVPAPARPATP